MNVYVVFVRTCFILIILCPFIFLNVYYFFIYLFVYLLVCLFITHILNLFTDSFMLFIFVSLFRFRISGVFSITKSIASSVKVISARYGPLYYFTSTCFAV